jgi:uncharacterized protein YjiS (DUF1127 family)
MIDSVARWRRARRYRAAVLQLTSLSCRELSELGIAPEQIDRLANAAFIDKQANPDPEIAASDAARRS